MSSILSSGKRKIRKKQQCFGCGRVFEIGTELSYTACVSEGSVYTHYQCEVCDSIPEENYIDPCEDAYYFLDIKDSDPDLWEQKRKELEENK